MKREIKELNAARAQYERDEKIFKKEISNFVHDIKNGLGDEIKYHTDSVENENKFIRFIKKIFNTCK